MPLLHHHQAQSAQATQSFNIKPIPPSLHSTTQLKPLQLHFSTSLKSQRRHYQRSPAHSSSNPIKTRQNHHHHLQPTPKSFQTPCMHVHPCPSPFRFVKLINKSRCHSLQSALMCCLPRTLIANAPYNQISVSLPFTNINKP